MADFFRRTGILPGTAFVVAYNAPSATIRQARILKARYGDLIQICDGVADNVEIQAAIDAVAASTYGYGLVQLSAGRFDYSTNINLKAGVSLHGTGDLYGTRLNPSGAGINGLQFLATGDNQPMLGLKDLTISGGNYGVYMNANDPASGLTIMDVVIERVFVYGTTSDGFHLGDINAGDVPSTMWGLRFNNNLAEGCGGHGVHVRSQESYFSGNFSQGNAGDGFYTTDFNPNTWTRNISWSNTGYGWTLMGSGTFNGNYAYESAMGILINGGSPILNGFYIIRNTAGVAGRAVSILGGATAPLMVGCVITRTGSAGNWLQAFYANTTLSKTILVADCKILDYASMFSVASNFRAVRFRNNIGYTASGDVVSITKAIDHAAIVDDGGVSGHVDMDDEIPAGSIIKAVKFDYTEAFNSDNTTTLTIMVGLQADLDAFNKTADPGENGFNTTTDAYWGESDCQEPVVTTAQTPRVTFTEDDDITHIISGAGAQGAITITITYMKA